MKVLHKEGIIDYIEECSLKAVGIQQQIKAILQAVRKIIALKEALKGKGGNAIRSFYVDVHEPFLIYMDHFLTSYQQTLQQMKNAVQSFEPDEKGFIHQSFFEQDLEQGVRKLEYVIQSITHEANAELMKIQDIIQLPLLDDGELLHQTWQAKNRKNNIIDQLHTLDQSQTKALDPLIQDLVKMKNYLSDMQHIFTSTNTSITEYEKTKLENVENYEEISERSRFRKRYDKNSEN
ncbi:LXG domain-containing protein [Virgibacillus pantothenticus]|uniref:LXG domain-containing protein n=1 Tax=Virgibacillus pantothenticus TaxID=1473 RepID=UPI00098796AF|nr:LXG domain-containing protein [Virgibacillus pantothenticus]